MSNPRYYWYGFIVSSLRRYPIQEKSVQAAVINVAIERAINHTQTMQDGDERLQLIQLVYFKKSHTIDGAAMRLHVSKRTAERWNSRFIYDVATEGGFL